MIHSSTMERGDVVPSLDTNQKILYVLSAAVASEFDNYFIPPQPGRLHKTILVTAFACSDANQIPTA